MGILDFLKKIPTANEAKGSFGEWLAKTYSRTIPGVLALHDILIDGADGYTSQIDLILVGNKGIYVIEMKMFNDARIYGDMQKAKWNYYLHGQKHEIYSPVMQNKKHIQYLKTFLKQFGDVPYFSILAMICDDFKISGECGENTAICNSIPAMERAILRVAENKDIVLNDTEKQQIFEHIRDNQHIGKQARMEHKEKVKEYIRSLENMKAQKICPYCKTELVLRDGKNGKFYGCKNYPRCRYTTHLAD